MTIYYRDAGGIVAEDLSGQDEQTIDFCDGYAYFFGANVDEEGYHVDRKIPISAIVRISEA
jgi:hypothetical protein